MARKVYRLTADWPDDERYGLIAQVRRASVSISANLAEGVGRNTPREIVRFSRIAMGSLYETDSLFEIATAHDDIAEVPAQLRDAVVSLARRLERFIDYHERIAIRARETCDDELYVAEGHNHEPSTINHQRIAAGDPKEF